MEDTSMSKEEEECGSQGNSIPYCSPKPDDIWKNGTIHQFVWNSQYPYYTSENTLDLYLLYKEENLEYKSIKSWKELDPWSGSLTIQVDDSWFPVKSSSPYQKNNKTCILYGFYLPSTYDIDKELLNPNSLLPSLFNFSIIQYNDTILNDNNNNNNKLEGTDFNHHIFNNDHSIPIWIIIIIVTTSITIILLIITFAIWMMYKRSFKNKQDNNNNNIDNDFDTPIHAIQNKIPCNPLSLNEKQQQSTSSLSINPSNHLIKEGHFTSNWNQQEKKRKQISDELLRQELASDKDTCIKYASKSNHP